MAPPAVRAGTATGQPLRVGERTVAQGAPTAVACSGLLGRWWEDATADPTEALGRRFGEGRPLSGGTPRSLAWCWEKLAAAGTRALLWVWANASWHLSPDVRTGSATHNAAVTAGAAAGRLVGCPRPIQRPWLPPIEPTGTPGTTRGVDPTRRLPWADLEPRVAAARRADHADPLTMPEQAA